MTSVTTESWIRSQASGRAAPPAIRNLRQAAIAATCLLSIFAAVISASSWIDKKAESIRSLTTVTELAAKAADAYFSHLEQDLVGLGEELTGDGDRLDLDHAYRSVRRFRELHAELFDVSLIRADGELLLTALNPPGSARASLAREPSFVEFIEQAAAGRVHDIGRPFIGHVSKVVLVPVRYAVRDRQNKLRYVISANLPHEYLRSYWIDAPITTEASLGLIRDNGFLLSGYPAPAGLTPEQVYGQPRTGALMSHLQERRFPERGHVQGPSSLDGGEFLYVFRRLPNHAVTLFVAMPMSELRAAWWKRSSGAYVALLLMFAGGFLSYRYALRRQIAADREQAQLEDALRGSEERLKLALTAAAMATWDWQVQSGELVVSARWPELLGVAPDRLPARIESWESRLCPDDRAGVRALLDLHLAGQTKLFDAEYRVRHEDGRWIWVHGVGRVVERDAEGKPVRMAGTAADITTRKLDELRLRDARQDLQAVQHLAHIGNWTWDLATGRHEWSDEVFELFGHPQDVGPAAYPEVQRYFTPASWRVLSQAVEKCLVDGIGYECDAEVVRPDGRHRWVSVFGAAVRGIDGKVRKLRGTIQDITERKQMEAQVTELAFYDPLTRLANRRLLDDRLALAMAAGKRSGRYGALMFIDLDNFKPLNDEHGHAVGDLLLVEAANRLRRCVREIDTVARFGGDEFVVMLSELSEDRMESAVRAQQVAEKVQEVLAQPYQLSPAAGGSASATVHHRCTASIGMTLFLDHKASAQDVFKWADTAMYEAKDAGRNAVRVHQLTD